MEAPPLPPPLSERLGRAYSSIKEHSFNLAHKKTPNDIWAALEAACPSEGDGSIVAAVAAGDGGADASSSSTSAAGGGGGGGKASKHKWKKPASSSSPPTPNRRVRIGPGAHNPAAAGNAVKTAKYNPVTFLPLFLFSMFSRAAYLYFLSQAALAWWSTVSPFAPFGPTLALSFVLAVAALKAAAEDRTRAAEDRRTNGSPARVVLPDGSLLETRWRHVKVGDVLEVRDGEAFPADLLCLKVDSPDGVAYIRTTNLDGESNLKVRRPADLGELAPRNRAEAARLRGLLTCEPPNRDLHRFAGRLVVATGGGEEGEGKGEVRPPLPPSSAASAAAAAAASAVAAHAHAASPFPPPHSPIPVVVAPVTMDELLLRGCTLRNSGSAVGVVVYAGRESRVQMNAARPPRKLGSFDRFLNVQISLLLVAQVVLCASLATCSYFWRERLGVARTHLALGDEAQGNYRPAAAYIGVLFVSFWILLSYMVPISLFVTMEIVKFALCSVFISRDGALASEAGGGGGEPARARNSDIVEDLGQVRHVFSDKTGTLTSNEMQLRAVAVKGEAYGDLGEGGEEEEERAAPADASDAVDASAAAPRPRARLVKLESFAAGGDAEAALEAFDPRLARATAAMRSAGFWREAADAGGSDADVLALATSSPRAVAAAVVAAAASSASSPALARLAASASPSSGLVSGGGGGGWRGSWMGGGGGGNNAGGSDNTATAAADSAAAAAAEAASPESVSGGRSSPAFDDDGDDRDPGPSPPAVVPTLNPAPVSARRRRLRAAEGRRGASEGGGAAALSPPASSDDSDDGGVPALSTATTPGVALSRPSFTGASPSLTMRTPGGGGGNGGRESATGSARRPPLPPGAAAAASVSAAAAATPSQQQQQRQRTPGDEGLSAAVLGHHMLDFWSNVCLCHSLIVARHESGSRGGGGSLGASAGEEGEAATAAAAKVSGGDKGAEASPSPSLLLPPPPPITTSSPLYPAYQGPSPDEVALADAARRLGFEFVGRSRTHITLRVQGHDVVHELLNSLEFTSERARMSVITRSPDGTIRLHAKGSDAALLPRLRVSTDGSLLAATHENLRAFSSRGLRTLLLASRVLGEEEWRSWNARHTAAAATLAGREKALARVAEEVERDLELVGVTAIEDKLADGVPAAVASLVRGGVKVWMITGDKQETAVNIGVACRLLRDPGRLLRCNAQEGGEKGADARLAELLEATAPWAEDGGKRKKLICTAAGSSSSSSSAAPAATATAAAAAVSNNSNSAAAPYPSDVTMRPAPISTATTPGESGAGALATGRTSGTGGGSDATRATTAATLTTVAATAAAWQLPPALPPPPTGASSPYLFLPLPLPSAVPAALYSSPRPPELVIDGRTLSHVLGRPEAEAALAELATRCSSVVVCRASPSQKAGIVRMMKARRERARLLAAGGARLLAGPPGSAASMALPSMALRDRLLRAITHPVLTVRAATSSASNNECLLAIGDGANDVAMLQAADIGVGLLGKEGRQAANNADFAFARFASLPRLLLVHGTLADHRLARLIKYSFYKNVAFAAMLLCFQFFSGFSGQALLDGVTSAFYNAFFTALPAGFFAGLDRPVRHLATLEAAPRAYNSRPALTARSFWRTSVLSGAVQGAVVFFVPFLSMRTRGPRPSSDDIWSLGKTMFLAIIGVVSLELALVARFWTWPFTAALLGSYFATWPWLALLPALYRAAGKWDHAQLGVGPNLLRSPLFWLQLALVYAVTFSSRLAEHGGTWVFCPRDDMILAEREELAERERREERERGEDREEKGGSGSQQQQQGRRRAAEVEGGERSGEMEAPVVGAFPASAAPAASSSATV